MRIDLAQNGEVAVRMVNAQKYDLVLMDMQMPVMDGIQATQTIRCNPKLRTLPIVAMTANVMASDREKCIEAGMNDHLSKPIDPDELFRVLLRWIKTEGDVKSSTAAAATAATVSQTTVAASDADTLHIQGVDTKAALRRTGGNRRRYESLLRRFAESQAGTVEEIRTALASCDVSTAERAAHSLKGAAGNLGATALADVAAKAEAAVKSGVGIEAALDSLALSLRGVFEAIGSALPAEQPADGADEVSADRKVVAGSLVQLKKLLKNDDGSALDFILDTRANLAGVLTRAEIGTLSGLVSNFDFDAALNCLAGIAARLSLDLG